MVLQRCQYLVQENQGIIMRAKRTSTFGKLYSGRNGPYIFFS